MSFYPSCLAAWNKLDHLLEASSTVANFKAKLLVLILLICPDVKSIYGIHDPVGLSYLTQLRVSLSKLNLHKFKRNSRDAMCPSNDGIASHGHFLLLYHSFDTQRRSFLYRSLLLIRPLCITNPSEELFLHILLYGCKALPADSN